MSFCSVNEFESLQRVAGRYQTCFSNLHAAREWCHKHVWVTGELDGRSKALDLWARASVLVAFYDELWRITLAPLMFELLGKSCLLADLGAELLKVERAPALKARGHTLWPTVVPPSLVFVADMHTALESCCAGLLDCIVACYKGILRNCGAEEQFEAWERRVAAVRQQIKSDHASAVEAFVNAPRA
jgi:hypothetical protein